jgi:hypothetical protein
MSLLRAARGGVIEDLEVDWGVQDPPSKKEETSFDEDFEMISDETASTKTAVEPPAPAPINLFDTSTQSTPEDLGPKKMIINLAPPPRIQQAPKSDKLPIPLYPGFRCSIFSIIKVSGQTSFPSCVRINGKVMGSPVILEIPVTPITLEGRAATHLADVKVKLLHSLAARALIQAWEDEEKMEKNRAEIERLGKRYSLASSATSFLAIDGETKKEMEKEEGDYQEPERQANEFRDIAPVQKRGFGSASHSKAQGAIKIWSAAAPSRPSGDAVAFRSRLRTGSSLVDPALAPAPRLMGSAQHTRRSMSTTSSRDLATPGAAASFASPPPLTPDADGNDEGGSKERSSRRSRSRSPQMSGNTSPTSAAPGSASPSKAHGAIHIASAAATPRLSGGTGGSRGGGFLNKLFSRPSAVPAPDAFSAPAPMQFGGSMGSYSSSARYADLTQDRTRDSSSAAMYGRATTLSGSYHNPPPQAQMRGKALDTSAPVRTPASYGDTLTVESIARAQQFDGGFPMSGDFIRLLTGSSSTLTLPGELAVLSGSEQAKQIIWVTVLVLAVLAKKFAKDKDSWEMLAEKSSEFVETSLVSMGVDHGNAVMVIDQLNMAAARNI